MKYFLSFLLSLITYLFFTHSVNAQWTKYSQNPVLPPSSSSWDTVFTASPTVLYEDETFKMWYQGYDGTAWKIGYATSSDGISWTRNIQPVITPSQVGASIVGITEPSVIKINNQYQMWFNAFASDYKYKIYSATSIDGTIWTVNSAPALTGDAGAWDSSGPTNPHVYFDGSTYHLWYVASGLSSWKIGYATSADGISWIKFSGNPINLPTLGFVGGVNMIFFNNQYHLYYHTGSSQNSDIYHLISQNITGSWSCDGNCSILHIGDAFDSGGVTSPFALKYDSRLYLWYSGSNGSRWQINLATLNLPEEPTPTPTPTPTATPTLTIIPTPTLTPTPYPLTPLIIIPGFMSSWNKEAIIHNQSVLQSEWKLPTFVKEYDGIIQTLKNLDYQENKDLFLFAYDWRKDLESTANDLQSFLQEKIWASEPNTNINIIGHSLGGLAGRIWTQKYNAHNLNRLITVGSPHRGTAQVYKAIEAGEIDKSNSFLWLAEKIILLLNKNSFETDKETINQRLPVLKNMYPTYEFLKKADSNFVPIDSMQVKNNLLISYNSSEQSIYPVLQAVAGDKTNTTLFGYTITDRTALDQLLNNYADGRPLESLYDNGDYLILSSSAGIGNDIRTFAKDHGEIIYQKDGIRGILNTLQIDYQDSQIIEGAGTRITPSLVFLMNSPSVMKVTDTQGTIYHEEDGIIFIENPPDTHYSLQVNGIDQGRYSVIVGEIGSNQDTWNVVSGEIHTIPPSSQTDTYQIQFDSTAPQDFFIDQNNIGILFSRVIESINGINNPPNNQLTQATKDLDKARDYFQNNKLTLSRNKFLSTHQRLFNARKKLSFEQNRQMLMVVDQLENLFQKIMTNYQYKQTAISNLKKQIDQYQAKTQPIRKQLLEKKNKGIDVIKQTVILDLMIKKLEKAQGAFTKNNFSSTEILLETIKELLKLTKDK